MAVVLLHFLEPIAHQRVGTAKSRVGGQQLLGKIQRTVDAAHNAPAFRAQHLGVFGH